MLHINNKSGVNLHSILEIPYALSEFPFFKHWKLSIISDSLKSSYKNWYALHTFLAVPILRSNH